MKLIILDRDGVINFDSTGYIKTPDEWLPIPGSLSAISKLKQSGYQIAVATNQSGIARGLYDHETLAAIHDKMQQAAVAVGGSIDKIYYCPHLPNTGCLCRKPKPGLLLQIAEHFACSLQDVPFIGDKITDVQAALAAGARPILLGDRVDDNVLQQQASAVIRYPDLSRAVDDLLS